MDILLRSVYKEVRSVVLMSDRMIGLLQRLKWVYS